MIENKYKTRRSFVLILVARRNSYLISTKWEPQNERNIYIKALE